MGAGWVWVRLRWGAWGLSIVRVEVWFRWLADQNSSKNHPKSIKNHQNSSFSLTRLFNTQTLFSLTRLFNTWRRLRAYLTHGEVRPPPHTHEEKLKLCVTYSYQNRAPYPTKRNAFFESNSLSSSISLSLALTKTRTRPRNAKEKASAHVKQSIEHGRLKPHELP